jgi:hypothetical protein
MEARLRRLTASARPARIVEEIAHRPAHAERAARTVEIFRTGAARLTATPRTTARN